MSTKIEVSKKNNSTEELDALPKYDMLVFCHLRWNFVYQRPQHLITRLSKKYKILLVEEPIYNSENEGFDLEIISPSLTIVRPRVNSIVEIKKILAQLSVKDIELAWFYSPAFVDLLPYLNIKTVVYDCMDELSQFKGASPLLRAQEKFLIEEAAVIFTGGKSLYEEKSKYSSNVHCFPSSVDVSHFKTASGAIDIPTDIKSIAGPIVGYIGVIDERINLSLIQQTAQALPNVSFVMIGPIAKIEEHDLPKETNIHYLGMKTYGELPNYLKAFSITMMPFALNEATQYISPTKTLEYMAAEKPIISTPIKDVVRDYSDAVAVVNDSKEFVDAIVEILETKNGGYLKIYDAILAKTSWNNTALGMIDLLQKETKNV